MFKWATKSSSNEIKLVMNLSTCPFFLHSSFIWSSIPYPRFCLPPKPRTYPLLPYWRLYFSNWSCPLPHQWLSFSFSFHEGHPLTFSLLLFWSGDSSSANQNYFSALLAGYQLGQRDYDAASFSVLAIPASSVLDTFLADSSLTVARWNPAGLGVLSSLSRPARKTKHPFQYFQWSKDKRFFHGYSEHLWKTSLFSISSMPILELITVPKKGIEYAHWFKPTRYHPWDNFNQTHR